jgi:hypothetical protein
MCFLTGNEDPFGLMNEVWPEDVWRLARREAVANPGRWGG